MRPDWRSRWSRLALWCVRNPEAAERFAESMVALLTIVFATVLFLGRRLGKW